MAEKRSVLHPLLMCLLIVEYFAGAQEVLPSRPSPPTPAPEIPAGSPQIPPAQPEIPGDSPLPPPFQPEIPVDSPLAQPPRSQSSREPSLAPISSSSPLSPITEVPAPSPSPFIEPEIQPPSPSPSPAPTPGILGSIKISVMNVDANGGIEESPDGGMSGEKEAGMAIGVIILALGVVVIGGFLYKKRRDHYMKKNHHRWVL